MDNYFESEDFRELLSSYEEQLALGESPYLDADDFADIADNYLTCDRPDDAMEAVERGLSIHPDDEVLLSTKSAILIFKHQYKEARESIIQNDLKGNDVLYQKAQLVYAIDSDLEKADLMFREWYKKEMDNVSAQDSPYVDRESYLHIISSYVELHDGAIENADDLAVIRHWIEEYMERFAPLGRYEADVTVVDICRNNNLADLLVKGLSEVLDEQPYLNNGWSTLALGYFTLEQYEQAIDASEFALAINPHDKEALLTRAYCHNFLGHKEEACCFFEKYWAEDDIDQVQGIPYSDCLVAIGKKDVALRYLIIGEKALEKENKGGMFMSDDQKKRYIQAMSDAIAVFQALERYSDCERCVNKLLALDPTNADFLFMSGNYQLAQKNTEEALLAYGQAITEANDRVMMAVDIALTLVMNNYDEFALEVLKMVDMMADKNPDISASVKSLPAVKALTYLKLGHSDMFLLNFKKAIESTPDLIQNIFCDYFPESLSINDYYDYAVMKIRDLENENNK